MRRGPPRALWPALRDRMARRVEAQYAPVYGDLRVKAQRQGMRGIAGAASLTGFDATHLRQSAPKTSRHDDRAMPGSGYHPRRSAGIPPSVFSPGSRPRSGRPMPAAMQRPGTYPRQLALGAVAQRRCTLEQGPFRPALVRLSVLHRLQQHAPQSNRLVRLQDVGNLDGSLPRLGAEGAWGNSDSSACTMLRDPEIHWSDRTTHHATPS